MTRRSETDKAETFKYYWRIRKQEAGITPPEPVDEYRFMDDRKYHFDLAWPDLLVAVEVEGNAWHVKGGGKHMQDRDIWKYNYAQTLGWIVLRFSPAMLKKTPDSCIDIVLQNLNNRMEIK